MRKSLLLVLAGGMALGCATDSPTATGFEPAMAVQSATQNGGRIAAIVDGINARLEAAGSEARLEMPWLFVRGLGVDPFGGLRTGARWVQPFISLVIDASDLTADDAGAETALVNGYATWNGVPNANLTSIRIADDGTNFDFLDGMILDASGQCVDVLDVTSSNLFITPGGVFFLPEANLVVGGWLGPAYFANCLGSPAILAITWFLSGPDQNGDGYRDMLYAEQHFNDAFDWVTTGAVFLGPLQDIESVAVHENGHALGLDHFGGPINRQPFVLKPNGRVFNPEAVMNPGYLGGEKRALFPTDLAGFLSLYAR
jgi:hypothetical protein